MFEFLLCVGYMHASTVRWTHGHYQFSTSRGRPTGAPLLQVAYSDPASGVYLGSPSIARLDAHTLLISHVSGLSPFIFLSSANKTLPSHLRCLASGRVPTEVAGAAPALRLRAVQCTGCTGGQANPRWAQLAHCFS